MINFMLFFVVFFLFSWIYSCLPVNKQMLALSATYPESLAQHLTAYMRNPTFVRLNSNDPALLGKYTTSWICCQIISYHYASPSFGGDYWFFSCHNFSGIRQYYKRVPHHPLTSKQFENKVKETLKLLSSIQFSQCLIFSNYQSR